MISNRVCQSNIYTGLEIKKRKNNSPSSSDSEKEEPTFSSSESENEDFGENECVGCGEEYKFTTKKDDWIRCVRSAKRRKEMSTYNYDISDGSNTEEDQEDINGLIGSDEEDEITKEN
ncbi:hypothetical protein FQR65_LT18701 [Abscondita terminalis]|nr:hypothetical protein FQR65_LT18701 [Abscondita terminalis]